MAQSPLTNSVSEKKIANSNYYEDERGLWFDPNAKQKEPQAYVATTADQEANRKLAQALHDRYIKKAGAALDIMPPNDSLLRCFKDLGYDTMATKDNLGTSQKFDLITSIHTFQHLDLAHAKELLSFAIDALNPGGYLFIRVPDRDVSGFERDLQKDFPCFWNLQSFLELLSQVERLRIVETYTIQPGQRDYFLQVFPKAPTICAGLIVKNEERDLPKCLKSIAQVADAIVIRDTGSTDRTIEVAREWADTVGIPLDIQPYLGASEKDETGDWKLWDFGKARNAYVEAIDKTDYDWTLWMDADDIMLTPKDLKNLAYLWAIGMHGIQITSGDLKWVHHRMWRTGKGVKYSGRCHEYPAFGHLASMSHEHVTVFHDGAAGIGESANKRNLRILDREVKEAPTPRNCFYLANTHKDGGRYREAVPFYQQRLNFGKGFEDEYWFAYLYMSRCQRLAGETDAARKTLLHCVLEKPDWAEFWMELAYLESQEKNHARALGYASACMEMPIAPTALFREKNRYTDQPYRVASFAAEGMGDIDMALHYAYKAKVKIGGPDQDWDARCRKLMELTGGVPEKKFQPPAYPQPAERVCWLRPGALGDVMMTLNLVRAFRAEHPNAHISYATHPSTSKHLRELILVAGIDQIVPSDQPFKADLTYNLIGYPLAEGYPEKPMRDHLLNYFAKDLGIKDLSHDNIFNNFVIEPSKRYETWKDEPYCTIHTQAGWSMYKNWPLDRWQQICDWIKAEYGLLVIQIGGPDDVPLKNGVETIMLGRPFKENLHVQTNAYFHMGIDSWSNHATNIYWNGLGKVPAMILWGSTQQAAAGYKQNINISAGLPCQPCFREDPKISKASRGVCPNPVGQTYENPRHECMQRITVELVKEKLKPLIESCLR